MIVSSGSDRWCRGGQQECTWVAKVCLEADRAASIHGVEGQGSIALAGPDVQKLGNSRGHACRVSHPGSLGRHGQPQ